MEGGGGGFWPVLDRQLIFLLLFLYSVCQHDSLCLFFYGKAYPPQRRHSS